MRMWPSIPLSQRMKANQFTVNSLKVTLGCGTQTPTVGPCREICGPGKGALVAEIVLLAVSSVCCRDRKGRDVSRFRVRTRSVQNMLRVAPARGVWRRCGEGHRREGRFGGAGELSEVRQVSLKLRLLFRC
jgi:hypothetical protein